MKKITCLILIVMTVATIAFAIDAPAPLYTNTTPKVAVQPYTGISPTAGKSRCDSHTVTKGAFRSYTTGGYRDIEYKVFGDYTSGAYPAVPVKASFNAETAYMPESSGRITGNSGITKVTFTAPSSASRKINTCIRR